MKCNTSLHPPPYPSPSRGEGTYGFTLAEVLVALVILSTSFLALIEIGASHTSNLTYLRDKTFAHWVAMNKLAETRIAKTFPELGDTDGTLKMGKRDWFWQQTVTETKIEAIRRVEVIVKRNKEDPNTVIKRIGFVQKKPEKKKTPEQEES